MAIIRDGGLSLEIRYGMRDQYRVEYQIWPRWRDEPIVNDAILKREGSYWGSTPKGALLATEVGPCGVLPLLRKVIDTNELGSWEPVDPDVLLAICPSDNFSFLPGSWWQILRRPNTALPTTKSDTRAKPLQPGDLMELILFVDTYNLAGCDAYSGAGLCFRMSPTRNELSRFYEELQTEYANA